LSALAAAVLPVVLRYPFAMLIANHFLAAFDVINFIALRFFLAVSFCVILRNLSAALNFVVFVYVSDTFLFARHLFFNATLSCVVARLVVNH
jgi:hypothetical protein